MNSLEDLANTLRAINEDPELRKTFIEVLKFGSMTQQVRVAKLQDHLKHQGAPESVLNFVSLLQNEKLAHEVLKVLEAAA